MDTLLNTVVFPDIEAERRLDKRVRFIDGRHDDEILITIDGNVAASVELAPQKMVVRDREGALIGYYDCPPSSLKREVLEYCSRRHLCTGAATARAYQAA